MIILADVESADEKCKRARAHHPYVVGGGDGGGVDRHTTLVSAVVGGGVCFGPTHPRTDTRTQTHTPTAIATGRQADGHQPVSTKQYQPAAARRRTSSSEHFASALAITELSCLRASGAQSSAELAVRRAGGEVVTGKLGERVFVSSSLSSYSNSSSQALRRRREGREGSVRAKLSIIIAFRCSKLKGRQEKGIRA